MTAVIFIVIQFAALFWFLSRGGVDVYFPDDIKTRFTDVWGQDHVLERVKENILYLEDPEQIESRGGYVPGGILLWGPPGTGKTLMAEAVAGETGRPYVFVDPGAFINMFMGVGILKVKSLFRKLRRLALRYGGVIVFFDEADSLGRRGALAQGGPNFPGGGRATPAAWQAGGCHGFSYLSDDVQWRLARRALSSSAGEEPDTRRNKQMMGMGMGGGGGMGTLEALLTELSGLKKPRGFVNRNVRRLLGLRPKPPPKYRMLVMMATNLPEALDEALLRPGRIDRIYKVGYPSKAGRVRTYEGYFSKVRHELTAEQMDKLATITPYATGATIKDLVNEALITAIRAGRDVITWGDVIRAKQLKELGPPEDVEYIERERHAVAIHEACHALVAYRTRQHMEIDIATIEKGSDYLGMVASIPPEDQFTRWRTEYETDILVSLASLAGERMFFNDDSSSGVSGDLESATTVASFMEGFWGMGSTVSSYSSAKRLEVGSPGGGQGGRNKKGQDPEAEMRRALADRIEDNLNGLLGRVEEIITREPGPGALAGPRAGDVQDADRRGRGGGDREAARPVRGRPPVRGPGPDRAAGGLSPGRRGRAQRAQSHPAGHAGDSPAGADRARAGRLAGGAGSGSAELPRARERLGAERVGTGRSGTGRRVLTRHARRTPGPAGRQPGQRVDGGGPAGGRGGAGQPGPRPRRPAGRCPVPAPGPGGSRVHGRERDPGPQRPRGPRRHGRPARPRSAARHAVRVLRGTAHDPAVLPGRRGVLGTDR